MSTYDSGPLRSSFGARAAPYMRLQLRVKKAEFSFCLACTHCEKSTYTAFRPANPFVIPCYSEAHHNGARFVQYPPCDFVRTRKSPGIFEPIKLLNIYALRI